MTEYGYRWVFHDPVTGESETVPANPDAMSDPHPKRNITAKGTVAASGIPLVMEGAPTPVQWQFSGMSMTAGHVPMLRRWCAKQNRVSITLHDGSIVVAYLTGVDVPEQGPANATHPERKKYTVTGIVYSVVD